MIGFTILLDIYYLPGLCFEAVYEGFTVDEAVGSTELCVSYGGDNVPPAIDATMIPDTHGKCAGLVLGSQPFPIYYYATGSTTTCHMTGHFNVCFWLLL